jgi:hypothetical protein
LPLGCIPSGFYRTGYIPDDFGGGSFRKDGDGKQADEYGIKKQDPDHDYDRHDNCVRIADSNWEGSYIGFPLGEIKKGETASKTFVMQVKDEYVVENLHMAVFVTEASDERSYHWVNGKYYTMNNAIDCDINKEVGFDYK